ncbi:MAG: gene transfer agent family protein [Burkholderiales bacterium]|nr:gene transfer agent family protein [Burkholderiales bacterium]
MKLGGKEYILRPSFEAMVQIETALGEGIVTIARRFAMKDFGARDVRAVLLAAVNSTLDAKDRLTPGQAEAAIVDQGVATFGADLFEFLTNCCTGGSKPEEAKPGEEEAAVRT